MHHKTTDATQEVFEPLVWAAAGIALIIVTRLLSLIPIAIGVKWLGLR